MSKLLSEWLIVRFLIIWTLIRVEMVIRFLFMIFLPLLWSFSLFYEPRNKCLNDWSVSWSLQTSFKIEIAFSLEESGIRWPVNYKFQVDSLLETGSLDWLFFQREFSRGREGEKRWEARESLLAILYQRDVIQAGNWIFHRETVRSTYVRRRARVFPQNSPLLWVL